MAESHRSAVRIGDQDAGGNDQVDWPIDRAFAEGDKAIGAPVLIGNT